jgi:hypothetical protein
MRAAALTKHVAHGEPGLATTNDQGVYVLHEQALCLNNLSTRESQHGPSLPFSVAILFYKIV